jgi:hypothetical protein
MRKSVYTEVEVDVDIDLEDFTTKSCWKSLRIEILM